MMMNNQIIEYNMTKLVNKDILQFLIQIKLIMQTKYSIL